MGTPKRYDLVLINKYNAKQKPVTVTVDHEDCDEMRRHLVDLAVRYCRERRDRVDDWIGDYLLQVRPPGAASPVITTFKA